jgi:cob(I)alamin adenosyltransferase
MKIYTKTGDRGETSLFGGGRVGKDHLRVEAYGAVDEANAVVGMARAAGLDPELDGELARIQAELFTVGADLATPHGVRARSAVPPVDPDWAQRLEQAIDRWEAELPPLRTFVLPGGAPAAAALHQARCVVRRAERRVVTLAAHEEVEGQVLIYLNRLSDLLFLAARLANHRAGRAEAPWEPPVKKG